MNLEIKGFCTEAQFCAAPKDIVNKNIYNFFGSTPSWNIQQRVLYGTIREDNEQQGVKGVLLLPKVPYRTPVKPPRLIVYGIWNATILHKKATEKTD